MCPEGARAFFVGTTRRGRKLGGSGCSWQEMRRERLLFVSFKLLNSDLRASPTTRLSSYKNGGATETRGAGCRQRKNSLRSSESQPSSSWFPSGWVDPCGLELTLPFAPGCRRAKASVPAGGGDMAPLSCPSSSQRNRSETSHPSSNDRKLQLRPVRTAVSGFRREDSTSVYQQAAFHSCYQ